MIRFMVGLRHCSAWRRWTAAVAALLVVVAAVVEMPAMAHGSVAGHGGSIRHHAQPVAAVKSPADHHAHHGGHAAPLPPEKGDLAGAATTSADDNSSCSSCPLCLALPVEFAVGPIRDAMPRAEGSQHSPFDLHPDPVVPPPRLLG